MDVITKIKENGVDNLGLSFMNRGYYEKICSYIPYSAFSYIISFCYHKTDEVEKEKLVKNEVVPIAFVAKQTSDNPGAKTLDTQEREKPKEEKPKSEPKIEKKSRRKES